MSKKTQISKLVLAMTHAELKSMAGDLVSMQSAAEDDGWKWRPDKLSGKYGLIEMLHSWAEGLGDME